MNEYYASYKQPKYSFNELSRFENTVRLKVDHSIMQVNLIESARVELSLSRSKRIDQTKIKSASVEIWKKFFFRGPKNVKVFDCLWAGAGGVPRGPEGSPEAPAHNQSETFTFFGPRKKNFFQNFY